MQCYDPDKLIRAVQEHLQQQGLEPELQAGQRKDASIAAAMLLRTLGITPAVDGVDALKRSMDKPWVENDDRNARFSS
jgi:hypothetical protein